MNFLHNALLFLTLMSIGCTQSKPIDSASDKDTSSHQSDQDSVSVIVVNENRNIAQVGSHQLSDHTNEITNIPSISLIIPREDIAPRYSELIPNAEGSKSILENSPNTNTHLSDDIRDEIIAVPINLNPEFTLDVENSDSRFDQIYTTDVIYDLQYLDPRNCGQDHTSPWCDYQYVTLKTYNHNIVFKCYVVEGIFIKNQDDVWVNSSCQIMIAETYNIDIAERILMVKADLYQDENLHEHTQREVDCTKPSYNLECEKLYREIERYCDYKSTNWCTVNGLNVSTYTDYTRGVSVASIVDLTPRRQYDRLSTWEQIPITVNELFDFLEANQNKVRLLNMDRERLLWAIKLLDTGYNGYLWLYELNSELKNLIGFLENFVKKDTSDSWITQVSNWWSSRNIEDSKSKIMHIVHLAETGDFQDESPY